MNNRKHSQSPWKWGRTAAGGVAIWDGLSRLVATIPAPSGTDNRDGSPDTVNGAIANGQLISLAPGLASMLSTMIDVAMASGGLENYREEIEEAEYLYFRATGQKKSR